METEAGRVETFRMRKTYHMLLEDMCYVTGEKMHSESKTRTGDWSSHIRIHTAAFESFASKGFCGRMELCGKS